MHGTQAASVETATRGTMKTEPPQLGVCRYVNAASIVVIAVLLFITPGFIIVDDLRDPGFRGEGIPRCAFRWHRSLSPKYERWARSRVARGVSNANVDDVSGTEWPVFGSVFYLMATESLQAAWGKDRTLSPEPPSDYARSAIEAAAALVTDPNHARWVVTHWGQDYLHNQNLFYRALLISATTDYQKLTGDRKYEAFLRDQVDTLSKSLDESPQGLLEDYPAQCYPTDVLGAIDFIRRADAVLGTDHSAFVGRAVRAFQGKLLDSVTGLPPFAADVRSGDRIGPSRGCGNSFMLMLLPDLWPDLAGRWYGAYEKHFWQHRWTAVGFREFPRHMAGAEWYADVDSGPVLAGHGIAACAFGVGAARANGRFDHAWPLSAEMLVTCWPLPGGTLAGPRILSNAVDAPYLGEAGILFTLTRQPAPGRSVVTGGSLPGFFYIILGIYFGTGLLLLLGTVVSLRRWRRQRTQRYVPLASGQLAFWLLLLAITVVCLWSGKMTYGLIALLCAQLLPRTRRKPEPVSGDPDAPVSPPLS
jgi:hypothetical protein